MVRTANEPGVLEAWLERAKGNHSTYMLDHSVTPFMMRTYSEFAAQVEESADEWRSAGIGPGHVVMMSMPSGLQLLTQLTALLLVGAAPLPLTPQIAPEALEHLIEMANPAAVVLSAERSDSSLQREAVLLPHKPFGLKGRSRLYVRPSARRSELLFDCLLLSTSGSTGMPKIVVHRVSNAFMNAGLHMEAIEEQTGGSYSATLPAYYSFGLVAGLFGALQMEKNVYFPEMPFYPGEWLKSCENNDITLVSITPSLLKRLVAINKPFPRSIRKLTIGGDHADERDIRKLKELYRGDIYLTYGLSEAGPRVLTHKLDQEGLGIGCMGVPLRGVETRIDGELDGNGRLIGELLVRTPTRMLGYWEDGQFHRDDFEGEWLRTGDIVCEGEGGSGLQFMERRKNMLITGGEKLYPGIIRKALLAHPNVVEARVDSTADDKQGFVPTAVVQLQQGAPATVNDLESWCKKRLRLAEIPRSFTIVPHLEVVKK
jgi:long-chain acyl-CoA synthetase